LTRIDFYCKILLSKNNLMTISLQAQNREIPSKALQTIRKQGKIPAELYGNNQANKHLFLGSVSFDKVFKKAGESSFIDLAIDEAEAIKVLVQNVQRDPVTDNIIHVDFYQVDMTKPFTLNIPLEFIGEANAVKGLEGTLNKNLEEVEISCLPSDLISHIDVDITVLETFEDIIRVKDLKVPSTITIKNDPEEQVAMVSQKKVQEEIVKEAAAVEGEPSLTDQKAADAKEEPKEDKAGKS